MKLSPALVVSALLVLLLLGKGALLQPPEADPERFDTTGAIERLARILGPEQIPHPIDSAESDEVRARILEEVRALGYEPRLTERWTCADENNRGIRCAFVRNIVFRAGPEGGGALLISAHYDSVPTGPGAGDAGIGVATLLEVAENVRGRSLEKPIIFLLNDGEELGLFGARDFVAADENRDDVDLVLNLEARGVRGPVMMFETSSPNGSAIDVFSKAPGFKVSNSMMTDVYKMLPNDTDVSVFLPAGYRALNLAILDGAASYHTSSDNIENLSPLSVGHMGNLATGVVDAFMTQGTVNDRRLVFTDLWGRVFIAVPPVVPLVAIISVMIASMVVFVRSGGGGALVGAFAPLLGLVVGGLLGFLGFGLLDLFRDEAAFWTAFPQAMQALLYIPAIMGAGAVLILASPRVPRQKLVAASFFWIAGLWLVAVQVIPGTSVSMLIPGIVLATSLIAGSLWPSQFKVLTAAAGIFSAFLLVPLLWQLETSLLFQPPFASSVLVGMFSMLAITPLVQRSDLSLLVKVGLAGIGAAFVLGTLLPAHTTLKPGHGTLYAIQSTTDRTFVSVRQRDAYLRGHLQSMAPFEEQAVEDLTGTRFSFELEAAPLADASVSILKTEQTDLGRKITLRVETNGADAVFLQGKDELQAVSLAFENEAFTLDPESGFDYSCFGRSCDGIELDLFVSGTDDLRVLNVFNRLPQEVVPLSDALPRGYGPVHQGEQTFVISKVPL